MDGFGASRMTVPSLSRMVTLFLENVAVQSCAHSGAIAVRDVDKSASRKTWASIRGPAGAIANFVDAMDWMTEPLGSATCNPLEARIARKIWRNVTDTDERVCGARVCECCNFLLLYTCAYWML